MSEPSPKSVPEVAAELWELAKDYALQETVTPIKDPVVSTTTTNNVIGTRRERSMFPPCSWARS